MELSDYSSFIDDRSDISDGGIDADLEQHKAEGGKGGFED